MKTTVIILMSLLIMISFSSFAEGEELKSGKTNADKEATVKIEAVVPTADLIVINLGEQVSGPGLPEDIREQFEDAVVYPKDAENPRDKEIVMVCFTYDDDGYIHVKCTTSSSDYFNNHVVSNIEKIRLRDGSVTVGKLYYTKFSFKRL
jgi:hypothetical protein